MTTEISNDMTTEISNDMITELPNDMITEISNDMILTFYNNTTSKVQMSIVFPWLKNFIKCELCNNQAYYLVNFKHNYACYDQECNKITNSCKSRDIYLCGLYCNNLCTIINDQTFSYKYDPLVNPTESNNYKIVTLLKRYNNICIKCNKTFNYNMVINGHQVISKLPSYIDYNSNSFSQNIQVFVTSKLKQDIKEKSKIYILYMCVLYKKFYNLKYVNLLNNIKESKTETKIFNDTIIREVNKYFIIEDKYFIGCKINNDLT
jgi:hypothetical protein